MAARSGSTGAEKETEARRFLREREGRVATGAPNLPRADRIRYEEVAEDLRVYYRTTGKRDLAEAEFRLKHLDRFFERTRAVSITPDRITVTSTRARRPGPRMGPSTVSWRR